MKGGQHLLKHNVFFFFPVAMSQFDWPIAKKKVESMEAPQNRRFYENMECLFLWPNYIGEKWRSLGKTYGIKARCYWEHIGNLGNPLGT
jgi:hypothetical protein